MRCTDRPWFELKAVYVSKMRVSDIKIEPSCFYFLIRKFCSPGPPLCRCLLLLEGGEYLGQSQMLDLRAKVLHVFSSYFGDYLHWSCLVTLLWSCSSCGRSVGDQ